MRRKRTGRKQNNRGVTLVELLVAVAILSIVLGTALGFLSHAMGAFNRGLRESNLQNEAQLTMARLQSAIVNANLGILVTDEGKKTVTSASDLWIKVDGSNPPVPEKSGSEGLSRYKTLYVYNRVENSSGEVGCEVIYIYYDNKKLWYSKYTYYGGSLNINPEQEPRPVIDQVLSEHIADDGFYVELTQTQKGNSVKVTVNFEDRDKTYEAENTFFPRNKF